MDTITLHWSPLLRFLTTLIYKIKILDPSVSQPTCTFRNAFKHFNAVNIKFWKQSLQLLRSACSFITGYYYYNTNVLINVSHKFKKQLSQRSGTMLIKSELNSFYFVIIFLNKYSWIISSFYVKLLFTIESCDWELKRMIAHMNILI